MSDRCTGSAGCWSGILMDTRSGNFPLCSDTVPQSTAWVSTGTHLYLCVWGGEKETMVQWPYIDHHYSVQNLSSQKNYCPFTLMTLRSQHFHIDLVFPTTEKSFSMTFELLVLCKSQGDKEESLNNGINILVKRQNSVKCAKRFSEDRTFKIGIWKARFEYL